MTNRTEIELDPEAQAIFDELEPLKSQPLRYINELGRRLAALIPEETRKAERAKMVAYLDEVAAREPSRRPPSPEE
ncbi:MAG: hypothetical protein OXI41_08915 [Chloroflexota bacterium]|nr:hypothetical protein [Chloroflexota bacterium]MDE2895987.1 hypothetical protein [Chloroflexota bacterium]